MLAIGHVYSLDQLASNFASHGRGFAGRTPLMQAAIDGNVDEARNRRGYSKQFDMMGGTALMYAAATNNAEIVKLLVIDELQLKMRCPVVVRNYTLTNVTALMIAAANGAVEAAKVLVPHEGGLRESQRAATALMVAAATGSVECAALLVDKEGGMQDKTGRTALMYAAEHAQYSCIEVLAAKEQGIADLNGYGALHFAAVTGHVPTFHIIAQHEGHIFGQHVRELLLADAFELDPERKTEMLVHLAIFC